MKSIFILLLLFILTYPALGHEKGKKIFSWRGYGEDVSHTGKFGLMFTKSEAEENAKENAEKTAKAFCLQNFSAELEHLKIMATHCNDYFDYEGHPGHACVVDAEAQCEYSLGSVPHYGHSPESFFTATEFCPMGYDEGEPVYNQYGLYEGRYCYRVYR